MYLLYVESNTNRVNPRVDAYRNSILIIKDRKMLYSCFLEPIAKTIDNIIKTRVPNLHTTTKYECYNILLIRKWLSDGYPFTYQAWLI